MYTEARNKATQKYVKNHYDRILLRIPKGEKTVFQEAAAAAGLSLNTFITAAIREKIARQGE